MKKILIKVIESIEKINGYMIWLIVGIVIFIACLMNYEVIMRYVFNNPTMFSGEFAQMVQVLFATLGAGYLLKHDGHINVDLIYMNVGEKIRRILAIVSSLIGCLYCGVLMALSWEMLQASYSSGETTVDMGFILWPAKAGFFIGLALLGLAFVSKVYRHWRGEGI